MKQQPYEYRHNRSRQILQSEQFPANVFAVIQNIYLNPFDPNLKSDVEHNLSSGSENSISDKVLTLEENGKRMANEFLEKRVLTNEINFFDTISKNFDKNLIVRKRAPFHQKNLTTVEVNRNILGKLLSYSMNTENKIDFKEALKYPLSPVPLSLCHADGTKKSCKKADIYNGIDYRGTTPESAYNNVKTYIFDLMAVIR